MDGFGQHTQKMESLSREDSDHIEKRVLNVPAEDIARHKLSRGHIFERSAREYFPCCLCLCKLKKKTVFHVGRDLDSVAESHLFFFESRQQRKLFVEHL